MSSSRTTSSRRLPSRWNVHEMKARKPRVSSWSSRTRRMCSTRSSSVSTWPYIIVAVVDMPSRCAWRMTSSHSSDFVFFGAMMRADAVDEDLGAAARKRVEAGVAQARERLGHRELRAARDVLDLRRRERVQVDLVARLDRAEEVLVEVDPEVGVVPALHEQARAADRERLLDLLVDHRLRQEVAPRACRRVGGRRRRSRSR